MTRRRARSVLLCLALGHRWAWRGRPVIAEDHRNPFVIGSRYHFQQCERCGVTLHG